MIDRIAISVPCPRINVALGSNRSQSRQGFWCSSQSQTFGHITIHHRLTRGESTLIVEASLPKLLMGNNVGLITLGEAREALEALHHLVSGHVGISDLPRVEEWRVREAELCWAWRLDHPKTIASALERQIVSRGEMTIRDGSTGGVSVYWGSKEARCRMYTKGHETRKNLRSKHLKQDEGWPTLEALREQADELLRLELCLRGRALRRWLGDRVTVGRLFDKLCDEGLTLLGEYWRAATGRIESGGYDGTLLRLRAVYPPSRATRLIEQWLHLREVGPAKYCTVTGTHRTTLSRILKALEEAGVGLGTSEAVEPPDLPIRAGQGRASVSRIRGLKNGKMAVDAYLNTAQGAVPRFWS